MGIGDDAAVIHISSKKSLVLTKDLLVEDIHFRLDWFSPEAVAHKALHTNLSDIAAMGASPKFVLLGLSIPKNLDSNWLDRFSKQFASICLANQLALIGGDTTGSPDKIFISVTLIGETNPKNLKFRNSAKPGDIIYVTGNLGDARAGLIALQKKIPDLNELKSHQTEPNARIQEGIALGNAPIRAMMDLSDGLLLDLSRMCEASNCGAEIDAETIPTSPELKKSAKQLGLDPIECAIIGGEDYELLFTAPQKSLAKIKLPFFPIGKIKAEKGVVFKLNGQPLKLNQTPYTHFDE
jgi:thiamine-monophosphate kinase